MEIFNYQTIEKETHIMETCDSLIMHGQVYDKNTMAVEPLNRISIVGDGEKTLNVNRWCYMDSDTNTLSKNRYEARSRSDMIVRDSNDSSISYVFSQRTEYSGYLGQVSKIKKTDNKSSLVWKASPPILTAYATQVMSVVEVIGQTENSIIVTVASSHTHSSAVKININAIFSINKSNGTFKSITGFEYSHLAGGSSNESNYGVVCQKIYEDEINLYALSFNPKANIRAVNGIASGNAEIYVISKATDSLKKIPLTNDGETNAIYAYFSKGILKDGKIMFYQYLEPLNPRMRLIMLDATSHEITTKNVIVTFNEKVKTLPTLSSLTDITDLSATLDLLIKEIDGLKYLFFIGCMAKRYGVNHNDLYKIKAFLIDEKNGLDLIAQGEVNPYNGTTIRGFVEMMDNKHFILSNKASVDIYKFNTEKANFDKVQYIPTMCNSIGCGQDNSIWIKESGGNVKHIDLDYTLNVNIEFIDNNYNYKGENIETSIKLETINYEGDYVSQELELSISGPAYFADDKKNLIVTTKAGEPLVVPIVIKDSGVLTIYPKVII